MSTCAVGAVFFAHESTKLQQCVLLGVFPFFDYLRVLVPGMYESFHGTRGHISSPSSIHIDLSSVVTAKVQRHFSVF